MACIAGGDTGLSTVEQGAHGADQAAGGEGGDGVLQGVAQGLDGQGGADPGRSPSQLPSLHQSTLPQPILAATPGAAVFCCLLP